MSENPATAENPGIHDATIEQLEQMLADAERQIGELRAELRERRSTQRHIQMAALPDDLSRFEGHWRDLIGYLRTILRSD
ncbi:hypothetical protein [Corynebacterium sp. 335C]